MKNFCKNNYFLFVAVGAAMVIASVLMIVWAKALPPVILAGVAALLSSGVVLVVMFILKHTSSKCKKHFDKMLLYWIEKLKHQLADDDAVNK